MFREFTDLDIHNIDIQRVNHTFIECFETYRVMNYGT